MKIKRFTLTILSALLLTSCSGETAELLSFIDDSTRVDYDGYECYFLQRKDNSFEEETHILNYDKNTLQGEAMLKRVDDIKKDVNVNVLFDYSYDEETYQVAAMSGLINADIVSICYMNSMQLLASGGYLYPITDFSEYIDLSDTAKYGGANVLEAVMINQVPYAVQPLYWPGFQTVENEIMVSNIDMLSVNGITNFHEFYENGTWTWDTFENEFLKKFNVKRSNGTVPAISIPEDNLFDLFIYSNNVQFVTKNELGENVVNTIPESFIHAYDKMLEWITNYPDNIDLDSPWGQCEDFINEDVAATFTHGREVTNGVIAYMDNSFAYNIMPFPAGPDAPYGKWANFLTTMRGIGISRASAEPKVAAHTLSLLLEPFEEFGGDAGLYEFYNDSFFISETDTEIYFDMMNDVRYDYTFWDQHDVGELMADYFANSAQDGLSVYEAYGKYGYQIDKIVYNYLLPNYDYMYENYYQFEE